MLIKGAKKTEGLSDMNLVASCNRTIPKAILFLRQAKTSK